MGYFLLGFLAGFVAAICGVICGLAITAIGKVEE
uniref:DUF3789 domain-containing protein n=1 Tax=Streptomyces phage Scarif TaxID=3158858 RepID=A0AAU7GZ24_9CAUD